VTSFRVAPAGAVAQSELRTCGGRCDTGSGVKKGGNGDQRHRAENALQDGAGYPCDTQLIQADGPALILLDACLAVTISPSLAQAQEETMTIARALMVEDEYPVAQALQRRVAALGHTVVGLAASGEDAMAQADTLQPDVVLMDIG
jgi:hypothetical protein